MRKRTQRIIGGLLLLFLLSSFLLIPVGATESTVAPSGQGIKIMTYNVMDDCSANSNGVFPYDSPANREDAIVQMLRNYDPDIIGMQEAGDGGASGILDWCSALNADLKDTYNYRSLTDETGYKMDICRGLIIFYKKDRFTLLESGAKGYSQPANNKRCYQWVKLRDNQTGVELYVFNTHWTVDGKISLEENEAIRTVEMQELADKIKSIAKDQHVFITGDFNSFYAPKNSMGDMVNITALQRETGFVDALLSTEDKCSINANGTKTVLQPDDSGLMTSADHVVYPPEFFAPVKLERILSRTYSPKLSDHDAFLVHFNYKRPTLTAKVSSGDMEAYFSNGAYYIDYMTRGTKAVPITVDLLMGEIYTDAPCTKSAGTDLTIQNAASNTYMSKNAYYIKFGSEVYPLYLRACNSAPLTNGVLVDPSLKDKAPGSKGLYCDKWYCRPVTVGVDGFATIQEAVDAAKDGDRIMVAPGTYTEEVTYSGKNLEFHGSNRNASKALVMKNGQLTVNPNRTYETYLSGSITFAFGNLENGSLMVKGFHFIDSTPTGQIRVTGGNDRKTVDLRISNNLFNCYTDGSVNNGSAIHLNTALRKTGSIVDNYFCLTEIPTYTDSSGAEVNYTNRGITMRNMKDMVIHGNYFKGYTGNKLRPFWLSSEVTSDSTANGYGVLCLTGNRLENCTNGSVHINNIRGNTYADVLIAGNDYGGQKIAVDLRETAKQESQSLPTDKTKISLALRTDDLPYVNIMPKTDSGVTPTEFTDYVVFYNDNSTVVYDVAPILTGGASYNGRTPDKESTASLHYTFKEWADAEGNPVDLTGLSQTTEVYASYAGESHNLVQRDVKAATCTEDGYTGDKECTLCGHVIEGSVIPALGHAVVTVQGKAPTCTAGGYTDSASCSRCKAVLKTKETLAALGHDYVARITKTPTLEEEGLRTLTCSRDSGHVIEETLEPLSPSLYFTFDNGTQSAQRYDNYVYGFANFDIIEAWRGRTQGYKEGTATIDPTAGALKVQGGETGFGSLFADSVNLDLNFDPSQADNYQIRFKSEGFTGTACKIGMYFYYSTDNSYVAAGSVAFGGEILNDGQYHIATGTIPDRVRNLEEVNRVVIYLSGFTAPTDLKGALTLDYVYVGPAEDLPTPQYKVTFVDGAGKTLATQVVYKGETAVYTGTTPTKVYDSTNHYTFKGWDKDLTNITADTTITAVYTAIPHSYEDGTCVCGHVEVKEPVEESTWKLGHSLNLASDISINYAIGRSTLAGYDLDSIYILAEIDSYKDGKYSLKEVKLLPVVNGSYYYFTLSGLTAVNMNDEIRAVLYGTKDGQVHYSPIDTYSVATYAYAQLPKASAPQKLKVLCAELLRYGAKAQIFKSYRLDALVDAKMTEEQKALLSDMEAVTFGNTNLTENIPGTNTVQWLGKSLDLASKVSVKFIFSLGSYTGSTEDLTMKVTYKDVNGKDKEKIITDLEVYNESRGYYAFTLDSLLAAELRSVLKVQILSGDTVVSGTLQYAADTYGNGKTDALGDLCKALFAYSDSAKAYFS